MKGSKKKKPKEQSVFDGIRKPTAPPTRRFDVKRGNEKQMPSLRKAKHKKPHQSEE